MEVDKQTAIEVARSTAPSVGVLALGFSLGLTWIGMQINAEVTCGLIAQSSVCGVLGSAEQLAIQTAAVGTIALVGAMVLEKHQ